MVSYWKFDEGSGTIAGDSVGENDGTIYGTSWTTGIVGSAISFDGIDDGIEINNEENFDFEYTQPLTIETWINYIGDDSIPQTIVGKNMEPYPYTGYILYIHASKLTFQLIGTDHNYQLATESNISPNQWTHVAVTYDGSGDASGVTHYKNGVESPSYVMYNKYGGSSLTDWPLYIGTRGTGWNFNGKIDEVAIYNRILTPEEIQEHYENGLLGLTYDCWEYVFEDQRRDTILKIDTDDNYFKFVAPDNSYSTRISSKMIVFRRYLILRHQDEEIKINAFADTKRDYCIAYLNDKITSKRYTLIDKPGTES
jgi:hypothetical protein